MRVSRRTILTAGTLAALTRACDASRSQVLSPARGVLKDGLLDDVLSRALSAARKAGASYADVRIVRRRTEGISTREDHIVSVSYAESYGVGVRVIVDGAWGFAAAATVDSPSAEGAALRAVEVARAAAPFVKRRVELASTSVHKDAWHTPMKLDPFEVPLADKAEYLMALWPLVRDVPLVKFATASFEALGEWKIFASSEGSVIEQSVTRIAPSFSVTAVAAGKFESRNSEVPPMQAGWEYVTESRLRTEARRIADDAVMKLKSPSVTAGKRDLILAPSNLWLTIHESVGHPTELDRALGYEANFAGTSFATIDQLGKLKYGADIVSIYADKTTPGALASCAYDDDGVKTQRWDLVKDGVFVGYQTTRDQAAFIGEKESRGTSYAEDHKSVPFQRMPNVSLAPGTKNQTLEDIVSATDDGIYITGNGSWSIDHQRYNFQFSGQMFYEVKGGKIVGALRDVAYQSNSLEFWRSCDMIGSPRLWELHGSLHDGKGEPAQSNAVSHGCPPARFRGVNILNTSSNGAHT